MTDVHPNRGLILSGNELDGAVRRRGEAMHRAFERHRRNLTAIYIVAQKGRSVCQVKMRELTNTASPQDVYGVFRNAIKEQSRTRTVAVHC